MVLGYIEAALNEDFTLQCAAIIYDEDNVAVERSHISCKEEDAPSIK